MVLCLKKLIEKNFLKTNIRFELPDPDYPSVNPYKKIPFISLPNSSTNQWGADTQAIRQFVSIRLFSTRKGIIQKYMNLNAQQKLNSVFI